MSAPCGACACFCFLASQWWECDAGDHAGDIGDANPELFTNPIGMMCDEGDVYAPSPMQSVP